MIGPTTMIVFPSETVGRHTKTGDPTKFCQFSYTKMKTLLEMCIACIWIKILRIHVDLKYSFNFIASVVPQRRTTIGLGLTALFNSSSAIGTPTVIEHTITLKEFKEDKGTKIRGKQSMSNLRFKTTWEKSKPEQIKLWSRILSTID